MYTSFLAVVVGGSLGCVLRWVLSLKLNGIFAGLPLGTLMVNLIGGLIIGGAMAFFTKMPNLDPAWRLFITTGFCGGLTTFSAFSAELMAMIQEGQLGWAAATLATHVVGSLLMTFTGFALVSALD
ncbi:fluoride efflux transporter CrcB [Azotobacter beijerinckii]|uniref:fluoride efflux transporter CrcB n=1 Tax=Azotobacter beijerinckii TaxID=170623 RepID=UPI00295310D4|nr:fluoride efflux transporter CrcB [Azotobacter beijerinckii]MDV7214140.1 fluoride efflux transporter CrcB [Azotobacter beijerinckii]